MKDYSEVLLILDGSGSMTSKKIDVIESVNNFVKDLPANSKLTLVIFNSNGTNKVYDAVDKDYFKLLDAETYYTTSLTPLYDAICKSMDDFGKRLSGMPEHERPNKVFCVIVTDGEENDSKQFGLKQAKYRIKHQQDVYNWKVLYLGANQDAFVEGEKIGISINTISNYEPTKKGFKAAFDSASFYVNCGTEQTSLSQVYEAKLTTVGAD